MRAIDCPCGHRLEGADDEELFRLAREHVDRDHPEMQRTDEQLRERVAADAYDVATSGAGPISASPASGPKPAFSRRLRPSVSRGSAT